MKAGDSKDFFAEDCKILRPFLKHSGKLYDSVCEKIRPGLTRDMNVLELAWGGGQLSFRLAESVRLSIYPLPLITHNAEKIVLLGRPLRWRLPHLHTPQFSP